MSAEKHRIFIQLDVDGDEEARLYDLLNEILDEGVIQEIVEARFRA